MIVSLFQIAKNTFRESLREPIFLLILLTALCLIGIYPIFTLFVFREQIKMVVDSAMATAMVFGWITAVLCASHAITREINNGTVLLLLAKPVNRPTFIIAKILGILMALTLFWFLTGLATLIAVRIAKDQFWLDNRVLGIFFGGIGISFVVAGFHNYLTRASYPMAAVIALTIVMPLVTIIIFFLPVDGAFVGYDWHLVPALVLILYSVWAMGTLATALSTRFELIANLMLCALIFVIGLMSDYLLGRFADDNIVAAILYAAIPNWQLFWMADALTAGQQIPWAYVLWGGAYILLFTALFVLLAVFMFWRREVGRQMTV